MSGKAHLTEGPRCEFCCKVVPVQRKKIRLPGTSKKRNYNLCGECSKQYTKAR